MKWNYTVIWFFRNASILSIDPSLSTANQLIFLFSLSSSLQDHINEVLAKWEQIDDEIWAKIIVFEKNRRVAKAYARSSVITINGSKHGFDGVR